MSSIETETLNMELKEGSKSCSLTKFSEYISFVFQPRLHSIFPPAPSLHFSYNLCLMTGNISFFSSFSGMLPLLLQVIQLLSLTNFLEVSLAPSVPIDAFLLEIHIIYNKYHRHSPEFTVLNICLIALYS